MITFLFWNLNRKPLQDLVADLVEIHNVDVLILAECQIETPIMLESLNSMTGPKFHLTDSQCDSIKIYARLPSESTMKQFDSRRMTIRRLLLPGCEEILLAAAHLPSKLHWRDASQNAECIGLAFNIREIENEVGHRRTIMVGDLNINPFEHGIVAANGLNAVMSRAIALRMTRVVQNQEFPFFYNPMWGYFGDVGEGPSGTFYRSDSEHVAYFWHMFDQVLIRPELLSIFKSEHLKILDRCANRSLLTDGGLPNRLGASDHLPLVFRLDL